MSSSCALAPSRPRPRELWILFAAALAVRAALLVAFDTPGSVGGKTPWAWGCEPVCLADAMSRGDGLADPFGVRTGPSAWLTPVYPGLIALGLAVGGGVSPVAALVVFGVQAVASALTAVALVALGARLGEPRAGHWAGWAWALHPAAAWHAIHQTWDATLVAAGLTGFVWLAVVVGRAPRAAGVAWLGLAYGALLMVNPAPAALLPALAGYSLAGGGLAPSLRRAAAFGACALLVCAPWMTRNLLVLGTPGLRSNLGVELNVGNNDAADGWHQQRLHPSSSSGHAARLREVGEVAFAAESRREALEWIRTHPAPFARLVLARIRMFWVGVLPTADRRSEGGVPAAGDPRSWLRWGLHAATGVAGLAGLATMLRGRAEGAFLRASVVLFGLPYYVTHVLERYRFPIDPLLVLAASCGIATALRRRD